MTQPTRLEVRANMTDEQIAILSRLAMILEAGQAENGIDLERQATYAEALRTLLSASKPAAQSSEPVAWRDPSNTDPAQSVTFSREVAEKWPHIYREALYTGTQPSPTAVVLDERAAPTSEYFVYDPNGGHVEFYETDAQRAEAHAEAIAEYRKDSISDGEWSLDVECIVSGVVTHKTVSVNDDGETCDYEACAASPQPVEQTRAQSKTLPRRFPTVEEIQALRDHGHGEEAAYWEQEINNAKK